MLLLFVRWFQAVCMYTTPRKSNHVALARPLLLYSELLFPPEATSEGVTCAYTSLSMLPSHKKQYDNGVNLYQLPGKSEMLVPCTGTHERKQHTPQLHHTILRRHSSALCAEYQASAEAICCRGHTAAVRWWYSTPEQYDRLMREAALFRPRLRARFLSPANRF